MGRAVVGMVLIAAGLGACASRAPSSAEADTVDQREAKAASDLLDARLARIRAELGALDRGALPGSNWAKEWAGTYYTGDGTGMNVTISVAPESGLVYTWHGCMGLYDSAHGDIVEVFPDGLRARLVYPGGIEADGTGFSFMSDRVYFVKWGQVRYLVPERGMTGLVDNYNRGGLSREMMLDAPIKYQSQDDLRRFSSSQPGRPELPEKYAALVIERPLDIGVTKVSDVKTESGLGRRRQELAVVELDCGAHQGVRKGMELPVAAFGDERIVITQVRERSSMGEFRGSMIEGEMPPTPEVGRRFVFPGADTRGAESN